MKINEIPLIPNHPHPGLDPPHPGLDPGSPPRHAQPFPRHARPFPVMPDLIGHLLARRSTLWTFRTLFPYFFCAKVHLLDLRDSGRNTLRRPWFSSLLSPVFKDEPRFKTFSSLFWAIFKDEIRFCTVSPPIIVKAHFPRPEPPLRPLLVL